LRADPAQAHAAEVLQALWLRLRGYDPHPTEAPRRLFFRLFGKRGSGDLAAVADPPQGLYLVGGVGRGKSMLMDLFFDTAEVARKRRIHFHAFMQEAHRRIHAWRQSHPGENPAGADPIPPWPKPSPPRPRCSASTSSRCHDITDAMILGRLFEALFQRGVVMVATSNTAPQDLFRGKPGRDAFLPFIALIQARVDVHHLEASEDYRRERIRGLPTWHHPPDGRAERALDAAFRELAGRVRGTP
jgi:cell division protein ZapE